jgi:hypothetical protein
VAAGWSQQRLVPEPAHAAVWGGLHLFSAGLAIGAAALVARYLKDAAAWPLGGFLATALYLIVSAGQLAVADAARHASAQRQAGGGNHPGQARRLQR